MNTEQVTSYRLPNGQYQLFQGDKVVGRAWRSPTRKWGLSLTGIYWRTAGPNRRGGSSSTSARTLRDCLTLAKQTLDALGVVA